MGLGTTLKIAFDAKRVQRGLKSIGTSIGNLSKRVAQIGVASAAAATAILTASVIAFTVASSQAASSVESLTTQFTTLLGSADKAGKRMEEIVKFAASTPYEIQELAETSKMLQTMGGNLLATGDGLRMVGDAAAMSGRPISEVGLAIGRVFNAITSGTSAGEMVNRLQELGLITGTNKRRFEELAAAQKKGQAQILSSSQALRLLKTVMSQTEGGMEALSATTEGKMSNMKESFVQLQVAFGTGMNKGLKVAIDAVTDFLPKLEAKFAQLGVILGDTIAESVQGDFTRLQKIGELAGVAIGGGVKIGLMQTLRSIGNVATEGLFDPTGLDLTGTKESRQARQGSQNKELRGMETAELIERMRPLIRDIAAPGVTSGGGSSDMGKMRVVTESNGAVLKKSMEYLRRMSESGAKM